MDEVDTSIPIGKIFFLLDSYWTIEVRCTGLRDAASKVHSQILYDLHHDNKHYL